MRDLAVEQIGDGGKPDMRMRPHIDAGAGAKLDRPHFVEKHEGPDHAPLRRRQRAPDFEIAEIGGARHDHLVDRIAAQAVARCRVVSWKKAHGAG